MYSFYHGILSSCLAGGTYCMLSMSSCLESSLRLLIRYLPHEHWSQLQSMMPKNVIAVITTAVATEIGRNLTHLLTALGGKTEANDEAKVEISSTKLTIIIEPLFDSDQTNRVPKQRSPYWRRSRKGLTLIYKFIILMATII